MFILKGCTERSSSISQGNRIKVSIYFLDEPNFDKLACKYSILYLNSLQLTYEFQFPENKSHLCIHPLTPDQEKIIESLKNDPDFKNSSDYLRFNNLLEENDFIDNAAYHIGIIGKYIEGNLFFASWDRLSIITTYKWDKLFSPPSVFEYLIHCINACLVHMVTSISSHKETRGCFLDYTYFKEDDKVDIALGYICNDCSARIKKEHGEEYLKNIQNIASRGWIGRIDEPNSFAHNLKKYYHVNIEKDSGFNKSFWEKASDHYPELPIEFIKVIVTGLVSSVFTLGTLYVTGLLNLPK